MEHKINKEIEDFIENFKDDFAIEEAEIWLRNVINQLIKEAKKDIIPKRISEQQTMKEIKAFPRKLDDIGRQNIRAKNYGWNLCIKEFTKLN